MKEIQTYHVPDIANVRPSKEGQYVLKEVAIELQAENERLKREIKRSIEILDSYHSNYEWEGVEFVSGTLLEMCK